MINEEDGVRADFTLSIADCDLEYHVGDEEISALLRGPHGHIVHMYLTREGLETLAPLVLHGLPKLVGKLDDDDAAEIADLVARGLRKETSGEGTEPHGRHPSPEPKNRKDSATGSTRARTILGAVALLSIGSTIRDIVRSVRGLPQ